MENSVKKKAVESMLEIGQCQIQVNANTTGVDVPKEVMEKYGVHLPLNLNYKFRRKIQIDDNGIIANLSFNGSPYDCFIPWDSIWGVAQGDQLQAFTYYVPNEIAMKLQAAVKAAEAKEAEEKKRVAAYAARRAKFSVVKNEDE